jgi:hypothetical protein
MKHFLINDAGEVFKTFDEYNPDEIKAAIVTHLRENPEDVVEHAKEFTPYQKRKYVGVGETLDYYEVNPINKRVSKIVTRGNRTLYINIED